MPSIRYKMFVACQVFVQLTQHISIYTFFCRNSLFELTQLHWSNQNATQFSLGCRPAYTAWLIRFKSLLQLWDWLIPNYDITQYNINHFYKSMVNQSLFNYALLAKVRQDDSSCRVGYLTSVDVGSVLTVFTPAVGDVTHIHRKRHWWM